LELNQNFKFFPIFQENSKKELMTMNVVSNQNQSKPTNTTFQLENLVEIKADKEEKEEEISGYIPLDNQVDNISKNIELRDQLRKSLDKKNFLIQEKYKKILGNLQFHEIDILNNSNLKLTQKHHFLSQIQSETKTFPAKIQRIITEISTLSTSLPLEPQSSVFLRIDTNRPDVMKILITGPVGTPYSNGCFLFDLYCPSNYPNSPPSINLQTTGK
jgi:hypothetical protein